MPEPYVADELPPYDEHDLPPWEMGADEAHQEAAEAEPTIESVTEVNKQTETVATPKKPNGEDATEVMVEMPTLTLNADNWPHIVQQIAPKLSATRMLAQHAAFIAFEHERLPFGVFCLVESDEIVTFRTSNSFHCFLSVCHFVNPCLLEVLVTPNNPQVLVCLCFGFVSSVNDSHHLIINIHEGFVETLLLQLLYEVLCSALCDLACKHDAVCRRLPQRVAYGRGCRFSVGSAVEFGSTTACHSFLYLVVNVARHLRLFVVWGVECGDFGQKSSTHVADVHLVVDAVGHGCGDEKEGYNDGCCNSDVPNP